MIATGENARHPDTGPVLKRCIHCFEEKLLSEYYTEKNGLLGGGERRPRPTCKACKKRQKLLRDQASGGTPTYAGQGPRPYSSALIYLEEILDVAARTGEKPIKGGVGKMLNMIHIDSRRQRPK